MKAYCLHISAAALANTPDKVPCVERQVVYCLPDQGIQTIAITPQGSNVQATTVNVPIAQLQSGGGGWYEYELFPQPSDTTKPMQPTPPLVQSISAGIVATEAVVQLT